jgi:nucleotide-binding universal stress UspA family protein
LLFGSVAERLMATSVVPVFLVHARPGEAAPTPVDPGTASVLVPLDGSTFSEMAIEPAADLVGPLGELILACVVEPPSEVERAEDGHVIAYLDQQEEARSREAREYLSEVASRVAQRYPRLRIAQDVRIGDAQNGISMAVADRAADLVVMATHGRTGISRAVVGSVAGAVLRNAPAPVVLVGPREVARAAELIGARAQRA